MLLNKETCIENMDAFDRNKYKGVLEVSKVFQNTEKEGKKILPSFPSLQRDLWACLYKYEPKIKDRVEPSLLINREIINKVHELPEFHGMREYTKLDNLASALGVVNVSGTIQNITEKILKAKKEQVEKYKKALENAKKNEAIEDMLKQKLQELLEQQKKQQQEQQPKQQQNKQNNDRQEGQESNQQNTNQQQNGQHEGQQQNSLQQEIDQAKKQLQSVQRKKKNSEKKATDIGNSIAEDIKTAFKNPSNQEQLGQAISAAAKDTMKDAEQIRTLTSRSAGTEAGQETLEDISQCLAITEMIKNNPAIKKTMALAGKMKEIALKKKKVKVESTTARQDVEHGNLIDRILPSELLLYKNPATKKVFLKNLAEGECLQYSPIAKEKSGKGPVVCCVDVSGSMDSHINSTDTRIQWAKSVAFALFTIAAKEKRPFYLIEFESYIRRHFLIKPNDLQKISILLNPSSDGGTDFEKPLEKAFEIISKEKKLKKADIIFITDGECFLSYTTVEEINKKKNKLKTKIYTIQIADYDCTTLEMFSDLVIRYDGTEEFTKVFEI
jgi:uncharacterized protein with von Willebrand factor type A (vWA) domain